MGRARCARRDLSSEDPASINQNPTNTMNGFDTAKPLYTLTVGEFFQMMEDFVQRAADGAKDNNTAEADKPTGRLVYGLAGIEELFHVSHKTAQYYKDHVIQEAVRQNGRKIVTDVDLALKLFNERRADK